MWRSLIFIPVISFSVVLSYTVDPEPDLVKDLSASEDLPVKGKIKKYTGKLVFIDDSNTIIEVQNNKNKKRQFFLPNSVRISKNGAQVAVNKLDRKSPCTVTYRKQDKLLICLNIQQ